MSCDTSCKNTHFIVTTLISQSLYRTYLLLYQDLNYSIMPGRDNYSDEHRIFLQGLMCRGVLDFNEVYDLTRRTLKACNIDIPEKRKECISVALGMVQIINGEVAKLGLKIIKGSDEETGKPYFMLINTSSRMVGQSRDLGTSVQSQWTALELEYLRLVATEILQSEDKVISNRQALQLTDQVGKNGGKRMTMEGAEVTITKLMAARWLKLVEGNSKLALDVRFVGEMESWMVEIIGADKMAYCKVCHKLVVRGVYCDNCDTVAWHTYCLEKVASGGVDVKCLDCNTLVKRGEAGARAEDSPRAGPSHRQESRGEPSKGRSRRSSAREESEDEEMSQVVKTSGTRIKRRFSGDSDSD